MGLSEITVTYRGGAVEARQKGFGAMRIAECVEEFALDTQITGHRARTVQHYRNTCLAFARWCEGEGVTEIEDVKPVTIKAYVKHFLDKGRKNSTVNAALRVLRLLFGYCSEQGYCSLDADKAFQKLREEQTIIKPFTKAQVKTLLDSCSGHTYRDLRDYAILVCLFDSAIRCFELCQLKPEHIHDDYVEVVSGKYGKSRYVPFTPAMKKAFMRYERVKQAYFEDKVTEGYYFLSRTGRKLTNTTVENMMKSRGKGIKGVRVSPHTARHTAAQTWLKSGLDLYSISLLLGHSSTTVTQTYLRGISAADVATMARNHSTLANL